MASRKLVRDFLLRQTFIRQLKPPQGESSTNLVPHLRNERFVGFRRFGVFHEFSNKVKGEADKNKEFQKSVKELKDKADELKGLKDEMKIRTKQRTEELYQHVDGVWTEAEATAKKVSSNVKEKLSAATEEVKGTFGIGKQEHSETSSTSTKDGTGSEDGTKASSDKETHEQTTTTSDEESLFGKFKSRVSSSNVSSTFQRLKEAKVTDFVKKGYDIVKDELSGKPSVRKHLEHTPPSFSGERSSRTDMVVMPSKQSRWSKTWGTIREKMQGSPLFKHFTGFSEPVVTKSQEIAEDMRERWETSDNPIVHKIQDVSDTILQETDAASSIKEIRRRDPSFSMPDFVAEVQDVIRPILNAYMKGDGETLKKYCSPEVINRCEAEHQAFKSHGIFFDNKILHISEVEVRETKMMGNSPIIIVAFQTQQVHCIRDQSGKITEGGKDTIHTVYYAWAMQQVEPEELGGGAIYPIWRLREMQQLGIQSLI